MEQNLEKDSEKIATFIEFAFDYCKRKKTKKDIINGKDFYLKNVTKEFSEYYTRNIIINERIKNINKLDQLIVVRTIIANYGQLSKEYKNFSDDEFKIFKALAFLEKNIFKISTEFYWNTEIFKTDVKKPKSIWNGNEIAFLFHHLKNEGILNYDNRKLGNIIQLTTNFSNRISDKFTNNDDFLQDEEIKKTVKKLLLKIANSIK